MKLLQILLVVGLAAHLAACNSPVKKDNDNGGGSTSPGTDSSDNSSPAHPVEEAPAKVYKRFAYVANLYGYTISEFNMDNDNGALSRIGEVVAQGPRELKASADGKVLYSLGEMAGLMEWFSINGNSGELVKLGSVAIPGGGLPFGLAIHPSGKFLYTSSVTSNYLCLYAIDKTSGALQFVSSLVVGSGAGPFSIAITPDGNTLYTANNYSNTISAYSLNQNSGAMTLVKEYVAGAGPRSVTVSPSGKYLYVTNGNAFNISVYEIQAGALTLVQTKAFSASVPGFGAAIDPLGKFFFAAQYATPQSMVAAFQVDAVGKLAEAPKSPVNSENGSIEVSIDPDGKFLLATNSSSQSVSVYAIDAQSGALTQVAGSPVRAGNTPIGSLIVKIAQ